MVILAIETQKRTKDPPFKGTKVSNRKSKITQCKLVVVMAQFQEKLWEWTSRVCAITLFVPIKTVILPIETQKGTKHPLFEYTKLSNRKRKIAQCILVVVILLINSRGQLKGPRNKVWMESP